MLSSGEKLLEAARRREIEVVLVWRLDRWGRSVADLLAMHAGVAECSGRAGRRLRLWLFHSVAPQ
jgi:hypothetical protein